MPSHAKSLRRQLVSLNMTTAATVVVLTMAVVSLITVFSFRSLAVSIAHDLTDLVVADLKAPLMFSDKKSAQGTLDSISRNHLFLAAVVYDDHGNEFVSKSSGNSNIYDLKKFEGWQSHERIRGWYVDIGRVIEQNGQNVGYLSLVVDLAGVYETLGMLLFGMAGTAAFGLLIGYIITVRRQHRISEPIVLLSQYANEVAKVGHSKLTVTASTNDEIGVLITHFNRMVTELGRKEAELEDKVRARTADLQREMQAKETLNSQLVQSAKLASIGTLTSGIAHELNNPLTAIVSYCQIIVGNPKDESVIEKVKKIASAGDRMRKIIDHLRSYSRESLPGDQQIFELITPIKNTLVLLESQLKDSSIQVQLDIEEHLKLIGDPTRIESVFHNFLINSRDAYELVTDHRPKIARIIAKAVDQTIQVRYEDNACGMPPEVASRIFDPFFTTKKSGQGTGLGLSITASIVAGHGGQLSVKSEQGEGTVFTIILPLYVGETGATASPKVIPIAMAQKVAIKKSSILIVDDEKDIVDILSDAFSMTFHVTATTDPNAAVTLLKSRKFDVVLTDIRMPMISGKDIAWAANYHSPLTDIYMMSGHIMTPAQLAEVTEGVKIRAVIEKPFPDLNALVTSIAYRPRDKA